MRITTIEALEELKNEGLKTLYPNGIKVTVGMATCGIATGSDKVYHALEEAVRDNGAIIKLSKTGCIGWCSREPIIDVFQRGHPRIYYHNVTPDMVRRLMNGLRKGERMRDSVLGKIVKEDIIARGKRMKYPLSEDNGYSDIPALDDSPFFTKQMKFVLRNCGFINPESLNEYIAREGYFSLFRVLHEMEPEKVIEEVTASGLRGRGGAGFPTGLKWRLTRENPGDVKYIICNADEGDPGAYMDRAVLEGDPHSVIEGMIIGGYAIGAKEGYIYVRAEYPLAVERLRNAIMQAGENGLLGEGIMGSGFDFRIHLKIGAGAFVCGEETALMASIEGRIGEPRPRPPFPAQSGLWGKPTNINNVETWANIPLIISRGGRWYSATGTEKSKGTKVFSLVGKINNTGLVEVPMGITLREMVYEVGGGIPGNREFKAIQTGGPSGGCVPASLMDLAVDYERLTEAGAIMGSGGMVVMDENTCMVDVAKYFLSFTTDESCGKCTPCRLGTKVMFDILDMITRGEGKEGDIELLEELADNIKTLSLCGLGQTAPNPVLTTIRYFRDEYEAHIKEGYCPSLVCRRLTPAPCQMACPAGIDVPGYVALIASGRFDEALDLIDEDNPLSGICGRVCNHPCEGQCKRGETDEPVSICWLKRFVADEVKERRLQEIREKREEKVAVIGSGPAGLASARDLALYGYKVTIFEALPEPGGMLVAGIPSYRLPREIIEEEVGWIKRLGVEIVTNTRIGKDLTIDDLKAKGFKAILFAIGAHRGLKLGIPGENEFSGIEDCIDFLRGVNLEKRTTAGEKVAVIGGGNAAIDSARTALRLGAGEVTIFYRRSRREMPADEIEIEGALEEGVKIEYLVQPLRLLGKEGRVSGMEFIRTELGEPDATGRRRPVPVPGSEFTVSVDMVIPAIGQKPDLSFLPSSHKLDISKWDLFMVDPETLSTNVGGIFACGDAVSGPATVIEAIAGGQRAAVSIDNCLRGGEPRPYKRPRPKSRVPRIELREEDALLTRPDMPGLSPEERKGNMKEVFIGLAREMAMKEARRCLRCDLEE